ncbi:MAG: type ISP restriction/modification enzyme [Ktedonobacteraceae bacterium]
MQITITHKKAIDHYYNELTAYHEKKVTHETAVRSAFQNLLAAFAQSANWVLIPEQTLSNGKRPDGTLRDTFNLPRGYWEAKDTKDDLNTEIRKKINAGYPISNTIFEDTRRAVLYQNNKQVLEVDLTKPKELINVLDQLFHYAAPDIASFEKAIQDFKESIPDLAQGLLKRIKEEHARNKSFVVSFATFLELCRTSLDPNMSSDTVDEMLVQHLLTERLFRTIFNNQDFTNRNVIAAEIEKVIQALTSRAFNRSEFLKSLDRFYIAIENAAKNLDDWAEKQHFLNTVYERFFQGFSIKQSDTHGIVYTPQEIVDFMCASVEEVLQSEFHTSTSQPGVQILDPCTGTGNFIVNLIQRISGSTLAHKYENDLFCNEIMLLPYYIASLNIEHAYYERMREYKTFEGICFADTLNFDGIQITLEGFSEKNTERMQHEKSAPIMVVIGNPPYNMGQRNENDNNKNRRYPVIDERISSTYRKDSKARLTNKLNDPYVKFFRWAVDRLQGRDGIVCYVSNNSFVDQIAFDGMRKHLLQDFTQIYHLDLHGNVRKNPKLSGTTHNVFGIQLGVGITIAVRASQNPSRKLYYYRVPEYWRKTEKLAFLGHKKNISGIEWEILEPDEKHTWLTEGMQSDFATFLSMGAKEAKAGTDIQARSIFKTYSLGVATNRDDWTYDFNKLGLTEKIQRFMRNYNSEVFRWSQESSTSSQVDSFVNNDPTFIKWTDRLKEALQKNRLLKFEKDKVRVSHYRPFCKQFLYFDHLLNQRRYQQHITFPTPTTEAENAAICLNAIGTSKSFHSLSVNCIPDLHLTSDTQCFPFYTYAEDGSNRRENITDWALKQFQTLYGSTVTKHHIFSYIYAILHHPKYRERYAENLKHELPRIPLLKERSAFETCVNIGKRLMEIHLNYEQALEYSLKWVENREAAINWYVKKMRLTPNKDTLVVNEWLTLSGIPQECFKYCLGNRSALEWVIDQYQVSTHVRSGIVSDPNRDEDPEYIVRLVGRIITVSVETVKLVEELEQAVHLEDEIGETVQVL